jgi:hypothetical protein
MIYKLDVRKLANEMMQVRLLMSDEVKVCRMATDLRVAAWARANLGLGVVSGVVFSLLTGISTVSAIF